MATPAGPPPSFIQHHLYQVFVAHNHQQIRIWTSSYAHEKIGFYIICYILYQFKFYDKQIYLCQSAKLHNNKYATMFLNVPDDFIDLMKKSEIIDPSQYIKFAEKLIQ